jgi:hypothetical protein
MIPTSLQNKLSGLRRRERLLQFGWGLARWVALVLVLILLACLADYLMDRWDETPMILRQGMFYGLLGIAFLSGIYFLWPLGRKLGDEELALWVEDKTPSLHHRLISAVQLNRSGALTEGMSHELIVFVTQEAEQQAKELAFPAVADHRRLKWSASVLLPVLGLAALPLLLLPELSGILLDRFLLGDREIPRRVVLDNKTDKVWPQGEKVFLKIRARGHNDQDEAVVVVDQDGIQDRYPLEVKPDAKTGETFFVAEIPPSSSDFTFRAYVGDGRFRTPGQVHFEPRPVVVNQQAWLILPSFTATKPNGLPYEIEQPRAEIAGLPGSSARVKVKIQKPVKTVILELLSPQESPSEETSPETTEKLPPKVRPLVMTLLHPLWQVEQKLLMPSLASSVAAHFACPQGSLPLALVDVAAAREPLPRDSTWAQVVFELLPHETAYRIVTKDEHDFDNQPVPRRNIRFLPEEPPTVTLLPEYIPYLKAFLSADLDFDVNGLPLPVGRPLTVAYACTGPYGLASARLKYRVLQKRESGNEEEGKDEWHTLELQEVAAGPGVGPFDPQQGAFFFSNEEDNIFFHAVPSSRPYEKLGRTTGGGRFQFQTKAMLPDGKGGFTGPKDGDQIEYYVEVFADPKRDPDRPSARSETRVKNVVSLAEFVRRSSDTINEEQRLRQLNTGQGEVFPKRK